MNKPFQRIGSKSNAHAGRAFEIATQTFFASKGLELQRDLKVPVGVNGINKEHAFDLGCEQTKILVECKSHTWTKPKDNVPSAKLTVWNEAMYYFLLAPKGYRKILVVLKDYSAKRNETLAEYYLRTYSHMIPGDVELWEYDEVDKIAIQLGV